MAARRYLSFLKVGPKLLKFLPGDKARDLRNWLQIYGYWNEGGADNVTSMLLYLVDQYHRPAGLGTPSVQVTPPTGARIRPLSPATVHDTKMAFLTNQKG